MNEQNQLSGKKRPDTPSFITKMERAVSFLNKLTHGVGMAVLFFMMCLTTFDVIGRYFFNSPITGAYGLTGLSLVIIVFFCLGMTQLKGDHISISFVTNKFPAKVREILNIITSVMVILILLTMSWQLMEYAQRLSGQTSGEIDIPLNIFAVLAAIGVLFFALAILLKLLSSFLKVVQKDES